MLISDGHLVQDVVYMLGWLLLRLTPVAAMACLGAYARPLGHLKHITCPPLPVRQRVGLWQTSWLQDGCLPLQQTQAGCNPSLHECQLAVNNTITKCAPASVLHAACLEYHVIADRGAAAEAHLGACMLLRPAAAANDTVATAG